MRDHGSIVQPAVDVEALGKECRDLNVKIVDTEKLVEKAGEQLGKWRLALGQKLVEARKAYPRSGPKAAGWGRFVADIGISQDTALRMMGLAGYVESSPAHAASAREKSETPTYHDAGVDKRPRKSDPPKDEPAAESSAPIVALVPAAPTATVPASDTQVRAIATRLNDITPLTDRISLHVAEARRLLDERPDASPVEFSAFALIQRVEMLSTQLRDFAAFLRQRVGKERANG